MGNFEFTKGFLPQDIIPRHTPPEKGGVLKGQSRPWSLKSLNQQKRGGEGEERGAVRER